MNLQNLTRGELRKCVVAEDGYTLVAIDASQLELRVVAILSQDPLMLEALKSEDLHMTTAIQVFGWDDDPEIMAKRRYDAKQMNFAVVYGADAYKIAEMGSMELLEAEELIRHYFATYKGLARWIERVKVQVRRDGYVTNLFGRKRPIPEIHSASWKLRERAEREAVNTIVQGTAVDIVKLMMLYLKSGLDKEVRMILQVHDEILLEVPDHLVMPTIQVCKELAQAFPDYPCKIEIGKCYGEMVKEGVYASNQPCGVGRLLGADEAVRV